MENKYKLEMSEDCGSSYNLIMTSDNLRDFDELVRDYENRGLRWAVKDANNNLIDYCSIHKRFLKLLGIKDNSQETKLDSKLLEKGEDSRKLSSDSSPDNFNKREVNLMKFSLRYLDLKKICMDIGILDIQEIQGLFEINERLKDEVL